MYIAVRKPLVSRVTLIRLSVDANPTGYPRMNQDTRTSASGLLPPDSEGNPVSLSLSLNFQSQPTVRGLVLQERAQSSRGRVEKVKVASRESGNSVAGVGGCISWSKLNYLVVLAAL